MSKSQEVANIDEMLENQAAQMQQALVRNITSDKIKLKGGVFKLPNGRDMGNTLKVVILCHVQDNALYEKAYNPKAIEEPTCFARGDITDEDMAPNPESKNPRSPTCESCSNNEWGSRGDGSKAKACKNTYVAAVIVPEVGDDVYELKISSTAMNDWDKSISAMNDTLGHYVKGVAHLKFDMSTRYNRVVIETAEPNPDYKEHAALIDKVKKSLIA